MLGSHHLHIKSTLIMCIHFAQMEADLLSVLFLKVVIICICYLEPLHFLNIRMITKPRSQTLCCLRIYFHTLLFPSQ